jgi:hypothetical protein
MTQDNSSGEKRHFTRIHFDAIAHITSAQGNWQAKVIDVSLNGLLIDRPANWTAQPGNHFNVELRLNGSDVVIKMEVKVSHMEHDHVGLTCEHIDIDSITHLRRLVELNLGDEELLNRELSELIKDTS